MSPRSAGRDQGFVGSTIVVYVLMQAVGLVNESPRDCFVTRRWLLEQMTERRRGVEASDLIRSAGRIRQLGILEASTATSWRSSSSPGRGSCCTCWREFEALNEFSNRTLAGYSDDAVASARS